MSAHHRSSRYGRYTGGPDPLAPPVDLAEALDAVAEEVMAGYSPRQALQEFLRRGGRDREGLDWDAPMLHLVDLQYSDVRPDKGLYNRLVARGAMELLLTEDEVQRAVDAPPEDTRAYFRGRCLDKYADSVAAASWDSVIFDLPGHDSLQRVPTLEPLRGTREHVGALLDRSNQKAAITEAMRVVGDANKYLSDQAPWKLKDDPAE